MTVSICLVASLTITLPLLIRKYTIPPEYWISRIASRIRCHMDNILKNKAMTRLRSLNVLANVYLVFLYIITNRKTSCISRILNISNCVYVRIRCHMDNLNVLRRSAMTLLLSLIVFANGCTVRTVCFLT